MSPTINFAIEWLFSYSMVANMIETVKFRKPETSREDPLYQYAFFCSSKGVSTSGNFKNG
jgi:hypothetical protein